MRKLIDRLRDGALGFAAIGFTSLAFLVVWGRAINSPTAYWLENIPVIGWFVRPFRAATDQAYDPAGEV